MTDHTHDHAHADHDHDHRHDHAGHSHTPKVGSANERVVLIGFVLTAGFMVAEIIAGVMSGSLALIADAGHMLTDASALLLAWAAFRFGRRQPDKRRTFGYMRLEVVAGLINAVTLFALTVWIVWEAIGRLMEPHEVLAGPMLAVAVLGLFVNVAVFYVLSRGEQEHVNIRGAMLHVVGDLLGSVAAIVAAVVIWTTGWMPIDPILSVLVAVLILRAAWSLFRSSVNILLEGAPSGLVVDELAERVAEGVDGVADARHVHVWSITSGRPVATLEIEMVGGADPASTTAAVKRLLADEYGISHATVEIAWDGWRDCALDEDAVP